MQLIEIHIWVGHIQCDSLGFTFGWDTFSAIHWDSHLSGTHSVQSIEIHIWVGHIQCDSFEFTFGWDTFSAID